MINLVGDFDPSLPQRKMLMSTEEGCLSSEALDQNNMAHAEISPMINVAIAKLISAVLFDNILQRLQRFLLIESTLTPCKYGRLSTTKVKKRSFHIFATFLIRNRLLSNIWLTKTIKVSWQWWGVPQLEWESFWPAGPRKSGSALFLWATNWSFALCLPSAS